MLIQDEWVHGWAGGPNGMRKEGMGDLFSYEGWGHNLSEEGLGEVV